MRILLDNERGFSAMTRVEIYDDDMKTINEFCDANDISPAEFIMELLEDFLQDLEDAKRN